MKLDLFRLCDDDSIKVRANSELRKELKEVVLKIKNNKKASWKEVSELLKTDYMTLWDYLNRSMNVPLAFVKNVCEIAELSENKISGIQSCIKKLVYGKFASFKKVKAVHELSEELAKIAGAVITDGYLHEEKRMFNSGRIGQMSKIVIRDQDKDAIQLCCDWFNNVFDTNIKPKEGKNHWYISFNNKIVFRYFSKIFNIPVGNKSRIVKIPEIILNADSNIKKAFISSIFLFEGGIDHRTGYAELGSMSKELIYGFSDILKEFGLEADFISKTRDRNGWKIRIRNKDKLCKFLNLFCIEGTLKYEQLKFHLEEDKKDLNSLIHKLDLLFPKTHQNTLCFNDVILVLRKLQSNNIETSFRNIKKELKREKTVVYEYLRKLENFGALDSYRKGLIKIWRLNEDVNYGSKRRICGKGAVSHE